MKRIILFLLLSFAGFESYAVTHYNVVKVDPFQTRQTLQGWGVSLCWWANMVGHWDDKAVDELVTWLVSPDGLNYNYFRYNIGGGDAPYTDTHLAHHMANADGKGVRAEMEGFQDERNGAFIWSRDSAQRRIMLLIKKKRPDAIFEAFSNSAPWWMTVSGCCSGSVNATDDNLRTDYYSDFAHYLVEVCKHYRDVYGIEFATLSPFNEPNSSWWKYNGSQEGCHFSAPAQAAFLKVLAPVLSASGLHTKIAASEDWDIATTLSSLKTIKGAGAQSYISEVHTHSYSGSNSDRIRLLKYCHDQGLPLIMSETGRGGSGISGALALSRVMMDDLHYMLPTIWVDWQYLEGYANWCMVQTNGQPTQTQTTYTRNKNYYLHQQLTRFIRKGYTFLSLPDDRILAALSPGKDTLVCAIINETASTTSYKFDLSDFSTTSTPQTFITNASFNMISTSAARVSSQVMTVTSLPQSMLTIVLPVVTPAQKADTGMTSAQTYLIVPRANLSAALTAGKSTLSIESPTLDTLLASQCWQKIATNVSERYRLRNLNGYYISNTGLYSTALSTSESDNELFALQSIDHGFLSLISLYNSRGLDLNNQATDISTSVIFYPYQGISQANEDWFLAEVPSFGLPLSLQSVCTDRSHPADVYTLDGRLARKARDVNAADPLRGLSRGVYIVGGKIRIK